METQQDGRKRRMDSTEKGKQYENRGGNSRIVYAVRKQYRQYGIHAGESVQRLGRQYGNSTGSTGMQGRQHRRGW